jgi:nucleotide-binding universal stress UspA family protein
MEVAMLKALVPVDGTDNSLAAIRHVVKLAHGRESLEIHLLTVEPGLPGLATRHVSHELLDGYRATKPRRCSRRCARSSPRPASRARSTCASGMSASVIAETARSLHCDIVVMGTHGFGTVTQLLLGSVSHEAIHLMDPAIPVTLVKAASHDPTHGIPAAPSTSTTAGDRDERANDVARDRRGRRVADTPAATACTCSRRDAARASSRATRIAAWRPPRPRGGSTNTDATSSTSRKAAARSRCSSGSSATS